MMNELTLDGAGCATKDDVYSAFFHVVGAPEWHRRNFDALNDSIANGSINEVEVPYRLVLKNYDLISGEAKKMTDDFVDLIEIAARGCSVEIRIDESTLKRANV
jgi:RNAse (barnase) inhibitor barstar